MLMMTGGHQAAAAIVVWCGCLVLGVAGGGDTYVITTKIALNGVKEHEFTPTVRKEFQRTVAEPVRRCDAPA